MARPIKYTVDYFPHICKKGKTLPILEARYGNNGYAFWFKLLEILATTDGHYFDANNPIQFEFLSAETRFIREETPKILDLLASIEAIDKGLWFNHKLIWCENLVKNVADVYKMRKGLLPEKPYFLDGKLCQNINTNYRNPINIPDNTQSKVKYSKVNISKDIIADDKSSALEDLKNKVKVIKAKSPYGDDAARVFAQIDKLRGYRPPKRAPENASVIRMLKNGYTPEQIIKTWQNMKQEPYYSNQELWLMTIESQIGAKINGANRGYSQKSNTVKAVPGNRPSGAFDDL